MGPGGYERGGSLTTVFFRQEMAICVLASARARIYATHLTSASKSPLWSLRHLTWRVRWDSEAIAARRRESPRAQTQLARVPVAKTPAACDTESSASRDRSCSVLRRAPFPPAARGAPPFWECPPASLADIASRFNTVSRCSRAFGAERRASASDELLNKLVDVCHADGARAGLRLCQRRPEEQLRRTHAHLAHHPVGVQCLLCSATFLVTSNVLTCRTGVGTADRQSGCWARIFG